MAAALSDVDVVMRWRKQIVDFDETVDADRSVCYSSASSLHVKRFVRSCSGLSLRCNEGLIRVF